MPSEKGVLTEEEMKTVIDVLNDNKVNAKCSQCGSKDTRQNNLPVMPVALLCSAS